MTIGTGVGGEEGVQSLAHGLLKSILHYKPDCTLFFGSELSKNTVESLKTQYHEHVGKEMEDYQFVRLLDVDRFDECFQKIRQEILDRESWEIIIDYTSGTKTMTMSAAIASVLYGKDLTLVSGERGQNGLVSTNTEEIKTQSLYSAYDKILNDKMIDAFNHHRFETALKQINDIVKLNQRESLLKIVQAYNNWDKFHHQEAFDLLRNIKVNVKDEGAFKRNKEFLGTLVNARDVKEYYLLADLINNAQRRCQEGKYDDALARLYRAVEFISQIRLKKEYGIDTSDVDLDRIPDFVQEKYQKKMKNSKIAIGLREGYKLLRELNDDLGGLFISDNRLFDLLNKRNSSILAHGFEPITGERVEEVKELNGKVIYLGGILYPGLDDLMYKAEFMKL